jgi:hypothetical protein
MEREFDDEISNTEELNQSNHSGSDQTSKSLSSTSVAWSTKWTQGVQQMKSMAATAKTKMANAKSRITHKASSSTSSSAMGQGRVFGKDILELDRDKQGCPGIMRQCLDYLSNQCE